MPTPNYTEQALRAAVNTSRSNVSDAGTQFTNIKTAAMKRVNELLSGNSTASNMGAELNLQTVAINAAIQGLELSFFAIKGQVDTLKNQRLAFDKERLAGIATFIIPNNKEENELSIQEQALKAFMDLVQRNDSFAPYLGIQTNRSNELPHAEFYSVLPYYKMSDALAQPISSSRAIDKQRTSINLFFKSALPDAIADIDNNFQTENKFIEFWKSAFKSENYLNDLRAPRFLMMSLANLLWNLQHPVDPETGYPLSMERNIELCREVSLFLNKLLNSDEKTALKELNSSQCNLLSFVRKIELHVTSLRKAFIEEHLYELNISDLTNNAHRTLRIMDKSVFELLYTRRNPITHKEQPDPKAAEELAYTVSYLNQLLIDEPELISYFAPLASNAQDASFTNSPPQTVIDVLILFIHSTSEEKEKLFYSLKNSSLDSMNEFSRTLENLNIKFIKPIKESTKNELEVTVFNKKRKEVAHLVARRLVPLITLVLEDFRVEVDTTTLKKSDSAIIQGKKYNASEQVFEINKMANHGGGYYVWELSPFVALNKETEAILDELPKIQYRFTEITKLLDAGSEMVQNYRTFLQYKSFQDFLIKCLNKIKEEYLDLGHKLKQVDSCLSRDKSINRNMQSILGPMTSDLSGGLADFSSAFSNIEQIISAPNFTEQQKQALATKIGDIHERFVSLFNEDSGILSFARSPTVSDANTTRSISNDSVANNPISLLHLPLPDNTQSSLIQPKQIVALRKLVLRCSNALSTQSWYGEKGRLFANLLTIMDKTSKLSERNVEQIVKELSKIALSYRPTYYLFQAAYGETRAAKELIASIKDPNFNRLIPIAELLLGEDIDPSQESDEEITQRLRSTRVSNNWEESTSEIKLMVAL